MASNGMCPWLFISILAWSPIPSWPFVKSTLLTWLKLGVSENGFQLWFFDWEPRRRRWWRPASFDSKMFVALALIVAQFPDVSESILNSKILFGITNSKKRLFYKSLFQLTKWFELITHLRHQDWLEIKGRSWLNGCQLGWCFDKVLRQDLFFEILKFYLLKWNLKCSWWIFPLSDKPLNPLTKERHNVWETKFGAYYIRELIWLLVTVFRTLIFWLSSSYTLAFKTHCDLKPHWRNRMCTHWIVEEIK